MIEDFFMTQGGQRVEIPKRRRFLNQMAMDKHKKLLLLSGEKKGEVCASCKFFLRYHQGSMYFKCEKSDPTSSQASDWRAKWKACGLHERG